MKKSKVFKYLTIALFIIIVFIFTLINISKYRFGYFIKGPIMQYTHNKSDIITLNDGNILVFGTNEYRISENTQIAKLVRQIPFEIYNPDENKFINYKFPIDFAYLPKGLLLNDNQLLLTFVYDYKKTNVKFPYSSMAIVNLKTKKFEKIIQKK